MINLKHYRDNKELYITWAQQKNTQIDWDIFDTADEQVRDLQGQLDALKAQRNELSAKVWQMPDKSSDEFQQVVTQVGELKTKIADLEAEYDEQYIVFQSLLNKIPSPPITYEGEELIVWASDESNEVLPLWDDDGYIGTKPKFDFTPKPHRELLESKWLLDQERAVKLSGSRFQILRGQFAQLQFALMQWVTQKLVDKWFQLTLVPQLVKEDALFATWFLPNDSTNLYRVNPKTDWSQDQWEEDDLRLIGTAEVPLVAQHAGETLDADQLPLRYVWFSSCYRREAGTYGKDTKGLIRLHQFEKIEMVSFVQPEDSEKEHKLLRQIEEEIFTELGIPFQRINICTWDLWAPAAKKYDLEAWFPGIDMYKEVTSTSNTTDFQTRRAHIKYKDGDTKNFVHSLNGTAVALGRTLAAIVENYQTADGDVLVPDVLKKWLSFEKF